MSIFAFTAPESMGMLIASVCCFVTPVFLLLTAFAAAVSYILIPATLRAIAIQAIWGRQQGALVEVRLSDEHDASTLVHDCGLR